MDFQDQMEKKNEFLHGGRSMFSAIFFCTWDSQVEENREIFLLRPAVCISRSMFVSGKGNERYLAQPHFSDDGPEAGVSRI